MVKNERQIAAGKFKAQCLALLDEVSRSGRPLVVTKRGKPVAKVVPLSERPRRSLKGSVIYEGDIISPIDVEWAAAR